MAAKLVTHHKGGKHHNLTRSSHYDITKKYEKQAVRTAQNKIKHIRKDKELKAAADLSRKEKADAREQAKDNLLRD